MKRWVRRIIGIVLTLAIVTPTYARNEEYARAVGQQALEVDNVEVYEDENESMVSAMPRGMLISMCALQISNEGKGVVGVYADTLCHTPMGQITMKIYLDVLEPGEEDWYTFDTYEYIWNTEDYVSDLTKVTVSFDLTNMDRSFEYRLRCNHLVYNLDRSYREMMSTYTSFISLS